VQDSRNSHFLPDVVTECDITECDVQPDGRLSVQCVGLRRLHATGDTELDGYRICAVDREVLDDALPLASGGDSGSGSALPEPVVVRRAKTLFVDLHVLEALPCLLRLCREQ
jgi:Lon protease-like protein